MITISNSRGWMSNSISYATISRVAGAAQHNAELELAGLNVVDHSRDMDVGERIYDYVLCGSVKKEYMDYLYQLARQRVYDGLFQKYKNCRNPYTDKAYMSRSRSKMEECQYQIVSRTVEGTLKFGDVPVAGDMQLDDYLIFRGKPGSEPAGIPVQYPSSGPTLKEFLVSSVPSFNAVSDIRIRNLRAIEQCNRLVFKGHAYQVRLTKYDEPIVLLSDSGKHTELLQRRLKNLWLIDNEMQRLANLRSQPLENPKLDWSSILTELPETIHDKWLAGFAQWNMFAEMAQERLIKAVEQSHVRLDIQKRELEQALVHFEKQTLPAPTDVEELQRLIDKINLFRQEQGGVSLSIMCVKREIRRILVALAFDRPLKQIELFEQRLSNFFAQINRIFASAMGEKEVACFRELCNIQINFFEDVMYYSRFGGMHRFLNLAQQELWNYAGIHPTIFRDQRDQVHDMLNDPTSTSAQMAALGERLEAKREALIKVKTRQIERGIELNALLAMPVPGSEVFMFRKGCASSECDSCIDTLAQMRDDLLNPGKDFTAAQLDQIALEQSRLFQPLIKDKHIDLGAYLAQHFSRGSPVVAAPAPTTVPPPKR